MKLKNFLLGIIVVIACMGVGLASVYAANFSDVDIQTEQGKAISKMQQKNYINGFPDGTFRPGATLTRAEFVAIINRMYMYYVESENIFTDVNKSDWFYHDVLTGVQAGYIKGMGDGRFAPNEPVTREQVCVMLNSILNLGEMYYTPVISDNVSYWAKDSVLKMVSSFIFTLEPGARFRATEPITRGEACMALEKCIIDVDFETVFEPVDLEKLAKEELKNRLIEIIGAMENKVIPAYKDETFITIGKMVTESMKKHLNDPSYDYVPDAKATYEIYRKLGQARASEFKKVIYDNIDVKNLAILFDFFYTPEIDALAR